MKTLHRKCVRDRINIESNGNWVRGRSWPSISGANIEGVVNPTIQFVLRRYLSLTYTGRGAVGYKIRFIPKGQRDQRYTD